MVASPPNQCLSKDQRGCYALKFKSEDVIYTWWFLDMKESEGFFPKPSTRLLHISDTVAYWWILGSRLRRVGEAWRSKGERKRQKQQNWLKGYTARIEKPQNLRQNLRCFPDDTFNVISILSVANAKLCCQHYYQLIKQFTKTSYISCLYV